MKIPPANQLCLPQKREAAFTLVEMMTAVGVFSLLVAAMVVTQLFGFRIYTLAQNRVTMAAEGRQTMDQIRNTIRQAHTMYVGSCPATNPAVFVVATNTQSGSALKIFSTDSLVSPYVIYYLDTNNAPTNYLKSYTVPVSGAATTATLASYVTNTTVFYAEDYMGNVLTNSSDNRVIDVILQFSQYAFATGTNRNPVTSAYQLRTRATQRILN